MIKKIRQNPLLLGSSVMLVGTMIANLGNYLYHLLMGRMLGPKDYGTLGALISLTYIASIVTTTLSTTIVRLVSRFKVKKDYQRIFLLLKQLTKGFLVLGLLFLLGFSLSQGLIGQFLHLTDSQPVILVGVLLIFSLLIFINQGILRSLLRFNFLSFNAVFGVGVKLAAAVVLVKLGFSVFGALIAIILGTLLPYLLSFYPLRFLYRYQETKAKINWSEFFSYSAPVLVATLGMTSLYTTDVILVKHLFPAYEAGLYSALAVLGKIVFFASSTVPMVMFPLVSESYENGKSYRHFLTQSLGLVAGVSLLVTAVYFIFPQLMVRALYGSDYLPAASYLGIFAVFISLYSLSFLLVNFFLSIKRLKLALLPFLAAVLQIILIMIFARSTLQVIQISIAVTALLLVLLLLFYFRDEKR